MSFDRFQSADITSQSASKRLKSEDPNAEIGDGARRIDVISQLEGVSHVLEEIFFHVDAATVCESVKVSTTWKRLINSLDVFVWKKNLKMSPTWRTLSARMEHSQPQLWDRMKKGDASSYREAFRYVEGNVRQIAQSTVNINFQTLLNLDRNNSVIMMSDQYVFIGGSSKVVILNRWTRKVVIDFVCRGHVIDMQLNERFLVLIYKCSSTVYHKIDVYDVRNLEYVQTLGTNSFDYETKFSLGSDVIFIVHCRWDHLYFGVQRWDPAAARFVRDPETEGRLNVQSEDTFFRYHCKGIYVDDKYLIVDSIIKADETRLIKVFSLETMQLVRERKFYDHLDIRKEYHDGAIVVRTFPADGQPSRVALWDVDKGTVQPIADHPSQFVYSFNLAHHPFQIVMISKRRRCQLLLVQRGQPTLMDIPSQYLVLMPDFKIYLQHLHFDGVQMVALFHDMKNKRWEIMMADLVG